MSAYGRSVPRKKEIEQPGKLLTATREMLTNRPVWLTFQIIECETQLPYAWLLVIHNDPDCRPAVHRVERLHDYLTEKLKAGAHVSA
jgi:hypothetical protein